MKVETPEYAAFCRRIIRSYAKRVADADNVDLADMLAVRDEMDRAVAEAVRGMRRRGDSWATIALGLGVTRQAAQMRYGRDARDESDKCNIQPEPLRSVAGDR